MKLLTRSIATVGLALALVCAGCGPAEDTETEVEVTTTTDDGDTTIIRDTTTVIVQPADTIIQRDTVVRRETDTIIRRDTVTRPAVSAAVKARIDAWLRRNAATLNQYGDPINTVYTGGTPLFDERTGRTIDRYEYIISRHSASPWMQPQSVDSRPIESRPRR